MVGKSALLRSSWSCNQSQSFAETASLMKASTSSCSCCSSSSCCKSLHPDKHQLLPCKPVLLYANYHTARWCTMSYDIAPSYAVQDKVSHCSQAYLARRCIFCNYIFNGTLLLVQKVATKAACLSSIRIDPTCPTSTTICSEKEKSK